ncbi:MAG TPA: GtrA family protein, partial [Rhizobiaceae bacterium]|nr:GtrA family protein [Rhizobiaceae bacterium]
MLRSLQLAGIHTTPAMGDQAMPPQRPLFQRLAGFGLAGVTGLAVDAAVLALLLASTPLGPFGSRVIAIAVALTATFWINRTLAFGPGSRGVAVEGARYSGVGLTGAVLNYAI